MTLLISLLIILNLANNFNFQSSAKLSPVIKLNNGKDMPIVGFGCWNIVFDRSWSFLNRLLNNHNKASEVIVNAINAGYRHLDSAYFYNIEKAIGIALRNVTKAGIVKREDIFITTKIWNNFHKRDRVVKNLKISLKEMGIEYVDLALIHFPTGFKDGPRVYPFSWNLLNLSVRPRTWKRDDYLQTWKGMEDAVKMGLAKSIGVANFNIQQLKKLIDSAEIKPVTNQVECNPTFNQNEMLQFCKNYNLVLTAHSPLGQGAVLNYTVLREVASHHGTTAAQVALRWNVQRGVAVLPKTKSKHRMAENLNIFDFKLSDEEMNSINSIRQGERKIYLPFTQSHPDYPFQNDKEIVEK